MAAVVEAARRHEHLGGGTSCAVCAALRALDELPVTPGCGARLKFGGFRCGDNGAPICDRCTVPPTPKETP